MHPTDTLTQALDALAQKHPAPPPEGQPWLRWEKTNPATCGCHLNVLVQPEALLPVAEILRAQAFVIDCVTGVDWPEAGQCELLYDFFLFTADCRVVVRTRIARDGGEVDTLSGIFPGANWHERETHDFFGIRFRNHPDLSPLLLDEGDTFHPLRKDYTP